MQDTNGCSLLQMRHLGKGLIDRTTHHQLGKMMRPSTPGTQITCRYEPSQGVLNELM